MRRLLLACLAGVVLVPVLVQAQELVGKETKLTTSGVVLGSPQISGDIVVFVELRDRYLGPAKYYDLAAGVDHYLTEGIALYTSLYVSDVIADGQIVYVDRFDPNDPSSVGNIVIFDTASGTHRTIAESVGAFFVTIGNGGLVAWSEEVDRIPDWGIFDVFAVDALGGSKVSVTGRTEGNIYDNNWLPAVGGGFIAWHSKEDYQVRATKWGSGVIGSITQPGCRGMAPHMSGATLVYEESCAVGELAIVAYDLNSGARRRVVIGDSETMFRVLPRVSGDWVSYFDRAVLKLWHLPTGIVYDVATLAQRNYELIDAIADIDGNRVVYSDTRDGLTDVYVYEFQLMNTSVGNGVSVSLPPATVTFDSVTQAGSTNENTTGPTTPPPEGFKLGDPPTYYDITTTATYSGNVHVCIDYSGANVANEAELKLWHLTTAKCGGTGGSWQDVTDPGSPDTVNDIICGTVTCLSPFFIGQPFSVTGPAAPVAINTSETFSAPYSNGEASAVWDFGDGSTLSQTSNGGAWTGTHAYASPGIYTVKISLTGNSGQALGTAAYRYVVVYDPSAGFVTGGGWITSPIGAYPATPDLTGKATFGFVAKYLKGATVPTGDTQFEFSAAGFQFVSTNYDWMVVAGAKAMFHGTGMVNDHGPYDFQLTAIDADVNTKDAFTVDRFRLKVWDGSGVVYDNALANDDNFATTPIGGGSIVIHAAK